MHINGIRGISIHITESKMYTSYLNKNHDSTLMLSSIIFVCHPFQPSSISLLMVGNTISTTSPFDVTKLQQQKFLVSHRLAAFHSQWQWTRRFLSLTTLIAMETWIQTASSESLFIPVFPKTMVSTLLSVNIFYRSPFLYGC